MNKLLITVFTVGATMILGACASPGTSNRVVLPLDHGPRAQTTPWNNQQRLLNREQGGAARVQTDGTSMDPAM